MHLWFMVVLLQIACVLQAQANDVPNLADVVRSGKVYSNVTNVNKNEKNLVSQTKEKLAQIQYNQLSLITRYVGSGYNLVKGNPEGDFNYGGVDPGIKTTNEIFAQSYTSGKKVYYMGKAMQVPDQVNFLMTQSCAASHTVKAISGRKSYMNELEAGVSISGGYSGLFASVSFSLSAGMARAEVMTEKKRQIVIQKNKICNYGKARYLYENGVARERGFVLSRSFNNSVKYELPKVYNKKVYMQFIEKWGTHMIITVDVGTKEIFRSSATYSQVYKYLKKRNSLSTGVSGRYGTFRASASFSIKTLNENVDQNTRLGKSWKKFTIGTKAVPLPIHLDLKQISKALDANWWGGMLSWRRDGIHTKQKNLIRAIKEYPAYVHAKKNTDPLIKVKRLTLWPDGTYALPKARWGCPRGWYSGWRYQSTEKHGNGNSRGITSKMRVFVGRDVRFFYCVKKNRGKNHNIKWPSGTYCIAKKGKCPHGFRSGNIYWDDKNHHNKNGRWGVLPDGRYNKDTTVEYCCRSDGNHHNPISLPTTKPFILYRYGAHCQRVRGMRTSAMWIRFNDENRRNKDSCYGEHPYTTCWKDQVLQMCYYYRK